jgi:hypothetical protein
MIEDKDIVVVSEVQTDNNWSYRLPTDEECECITTTRLREELKTLIQIIDFELAEATKRNTNASVSAKIILYGIKIQIEKRFALILKDDKKEDRSHVKE